MKLSRPKQQRLFSLHLILGVAIVLPGMAAASGAEAKSQIDFERDVRPILNRHCIACHGGVKQASGLSFVYREQLLGEADSGLIPVVPGDVENSEVIARVTSDEEGVRMPPLEESPEGLTPEEIDILKKWIEAGAKWSEHWAFEPPEPSPPPSVENIEWSRSPIDRFVLARLERAGWQPAPSAAPEKWLRRVTFDLTGLPPSLVEREEFLQAVRNEGEAAYPQVVDRLLASPHFGERWASVWLDLVRYADSKGLGKDERRTIWKYRDWVVDAFNRDLPYDEFTRQQIAGDLLPGHDVEHVIATAMHRLTQTNGEGGTDDEEFRVAAVLDRVNTTWQTWQGVTFGCTQCHNHPYEPLRNEDYYRFVAFFNETADSDTDQEFPLARIPLDSRDYTAASRLDERIENLHGEIWREEYAALSDETMWHALHGLEAKTNNDTPMEIRVADGREEFMTLDPVARDTSITIEAAMPEAVRQMTALKLVVSPANPARAVSNSEWGFILSHLKMELLPPGEEEAHEIAFTQVISDEPRPFYDPQESLDPKSRHGFAAYSRIHYPREAAFVLNAPLEVPPGSRLRVRMDYRVTILDSFPLVARRGHLAVSGSEAVLDLFNQETWQEKRRQLAALQRQREQISATTIPVLRRRLPHLQRPTHIFDRGNFLTKGEQVSPGLPSLFSSDNEHAAETRLELADWLASPENPLTARVAVNRLWARLFGTGLVETEEDFGSSGERPSHPGLLDYLAFRFQSEHAWSTKALLREIVLSSTYRQSARTTTEQREQDPRNRLLARGPRQRLTAEMIRDQALAVCGLLSTKLHGPPVHPPIPDGVWLPFQANDRWATPDPGEEDRYRRALYTYVKRSIPYPFQAVFDAPSREFCTSRRLVSNTPLQALSTLNGAVYEECAATLAERLTQEHEDPSQQIRQGFLLMTGREPTEEELASLDNMHERMVQPDDAQSGLRAVALVLLNLDEALTR